MECIVKTCKRFCIANSEIVPLQSTLQFVLAKHTCKFLMFTLLFVLSNICKLMRRMCDPCDNNECKILNVKFFISVRLMHISVMFDFKAKTCRIESFLLLSANHLCLSVGRSDCLVRSGLVRSGLVWSGLSVLGLPPWFTVSTYLCE